MRDLGQDMAGQRRQLGFDAGRLGPPVIAQGAVDVAPEGGGKWPLAGRQSLVIGLGPAIIGPRHGLDPGADAEIAHPRLAQSPIHVAHHEIEERLPQGHPGFTFEAQAPRHQMAVQHQQVVTPVQRVGHAQVLVESRRAGLGNDPAIQQVDFVGGLAALEKSFKNHNLTLQCQER